MAVQHARARSAIAARPRRWPLTVLIATVAITLLVNAWWLHHFRAGYPLDIDESRYLAFGLRLEDRLSAGGLPGLWHAWSAQHDFGPLLPLVSVPFYAVFGQGIFVGLLSQLVFFVVLVVSSYGIGARLTSPAGGLLVALVVATTPAITDYARSYQFAITDAALLTAATYALLASEAFDRRGWSCVWGVLVGLTPLARTMAIAFVPAQLIAAVWLIVVRPGARRGRWVNLAVALLLGFLAAATWLASSWRSVSSYLTNFGYGAQSAHFGHSGSRLSAGYWTREAVNLVRGDLYLPLAAVLAIVFLAGAAAWLSKRRGELRSRARRWTGSDAAIVLFVLLAGYVAVSSSRNEGIGFRVPLLPMLVALAVAALLWLPWRLARRVLVAVLIALSALNLVMKADVIGGVSGTAEASVPGLGRVPVLSGQGYIQGYVLASFEARAVSPTQLLPASAKRWLPTYVRIVQAVPRRPDAGPAVVDLATDEPLLNANDLILAVRLHEHRDLIVNLVPGGAAIGRRRDAVVTVSRVGFSYFALSGHRDADQGRLEHAAASLGLRCSGTVALPDGRRAVVSSRSAAGMPATCSPQVTHVGFAGGSPTAPVVAVFDLPMAWGSLSRAFALTTAATGRRVAGTLAPFGEVALVFKPDQPLSAHTTYVATVATSATAATGARLRHPFQWSLSTG